MCDSMSSKLATLSDDVNCVGIIVMDYYNKNGHDDYTHLVQKIINNAVKNDVYYGGGKWTLNENYVKKVSD